MVIYFLHLRSQCFHIFIQLLEGLGSGKNLLALPVGGLDGAADRVDYHVGIGIQLIGDLRNLFGKALGLFCQLPDLLGNNGETASGLPGTGTFNGSVQG